MTVYVSVDCGVRNLAYCVYHAPTMVLVQWKLVSLAPTRANIATIVESACRFACALVEEHGASLHTVYIEQQPVANVKMKCLSHALQAAFCSASRTVRVRFVSARKTHERLGLLGAAMKKGATVRVSSSPFSAQEKN